MATSDNYDNDKMGWAMVASTFVCWFVIWGNVKALGVLLISITNDLDSNLWLIGWVAVFYGVMQRCMGPVVGALSRLLGSRPMMVFGGILGTLGFTLTSIATTGFTMAVFIVGLASIGAAFSLFISITLMASYFKEQYPLALALSHMGVPVAMMVYGPVTQVLLDTFDWRGTMLLLGGITFHLVACAMLVRREPSFSVKEPEQYQEVPINDEEEHQESGEEEEVGNDDKTDAPHERCCLDRDLRKTNARKCCQHIIKAIDFAVLADVRFALLTCARCAASFSDTAWMVYMVSHGQFKGLSEVQASFLPTSLGVGFIVGTLMIPLLRHVGIKPSMTFWGCFGGGVTCASFLLIIFVRSYIGQMAVTGLLGFGYGLMFQAIDVKVRFIATDDRFVSVLGWQGMFIGVSAVAGGLISGQIYDWTGSFSIVLCVFAGVKLLSIPVLIIETLYAKRHCPASVGL